MKKLVLSLVTILMLFTLVSCAKKENPAPAPTEAPAPTQAAVQETQAPETTAPAPTENAVFKLGGIGPLTGGAAVYGQAVMNGAKIAVDEINAAGGVNGCQLTFTPQDDEHDAEKSVNAYNALKDDGMQILIGTVTSAPCIAVAAETSNDNIFQITPSGSAVECVAPDNVFRVCFSDPNQGKASAQYINKHKLGKKIGIIYDSSDVYSSGIRETFVDESRREGLEIVAEEKFTADSKTDFTTQIKKMQDKGADLVFLPFYYNEAALVLKQADQIGYKPIFFSCDGMDGILTLDNFDTHLAEGVMLLTPFAADAQDDLTKSFVEKYKTNYNEVPNQFAADAYDAVYIVKAALEKTGLKANESPKALCDALKKAMLEIKVNGLTGTDMVWTADGEPNKEPKAVKIVNGVYVLQ